MNIIKSLMSGLLTIFINLSLGQVNNSLITRGVFLPQDSIERNQLINSLNGFLNEKEKPNENNLFVKHEESLETSALLNEWKGIEKNYYSKNDTFYKAYLTNVTRVDKSNYSIQISYIGIDKNFSLLRASFNLLAQKSDEGFKFYSPLKSNTTSWKVTSIGKLTIHYKTKINQANLEKYLKKVGEFDKKLKSNVSTEFYCCDNFQEALRLIGVEYKSDYNSVQHDALSIYEKNVRLNIDGVLTPEFVSFDPHDLWHERMQNVLPIEQINKSVDEGCAYLYGGSWGISWDDIFNKFKIYAKSSNRDWLSLFNKSENFSERNTPPLNVDFVINALLVEKIEKEHGFSSIVKLLTCGKNIKENENYFSTLEEITGINKANFNDKISALINAN